MYANPKLISPIHLLSSVLNKRIARSRLHFSYQPKLKAILPGDNSLWKPKVQQHALAVVRMDRTTLQDYFKNTIQTSEKELEY